MQPSLTPLLSPVFTVLCCSCVVDTRYVMQVGTAPPSSSSSSHHPEPPTAGVQAS